MFGKILSSTVNICAYEFRVYSFLYVIKYIIVNDYFCHLCGVILTLKNNGCDTYIGEKREYTQIILETKLIALTENNYIPLTQAQISLCAKIGYMYYCEYAHLLKKCMEHTCMSAIYYDQGSDVKAKLVKPL